MQGVDTVAAAVAGPVVGVLLVLRTAVRKRQRQRQRQRQLQFQQTSHPPPSPRQPPVATPT